MSDERAAIRSAKVNIDAWIDEIESGGLDAIVVTASGCGTEIKDYAHLLRHDPAYAEKARRIAGKACDITEVVAELGLGDVTRRDAPPIVYHAPCSLQHGQGLDRLPQDLLRRAGFEVRTPREAHLCCGSAGIYNLLQPETANELGSRKVDNLLATDAQAVVSANPGCLLQLMNGLRRRGHKAMPAFHMVELLDASMRGIAAAEMLAGSRDTHVHAG